MLLVGAYATSLIEAAVTRNSAASTALYVDSIIALAEGPESKIEQATGVPLLH